MKVFMLGWEFPPHISGGLGTACYGMTKGLDEIGVEVCFVLPTAVPVDTATHVKLRSPADLGEKSGRGQEDISRVFAHTELHRVPAVLQAYATPESFERAVAQLIQQELAKKGLTGAGLPEAFAELPAAISGSFAAGAGVHYGGDLMAQVHRYARLAVEIALRETFDVIHAHDWMTYPAGLAVAAATGRPLVVHVHSTEFDRSGENVNQQVYDIERTGMHGAARVACVSYLTRNIVTRRYAVPPERVDVVYNAVELPQTTQLEMQPIRQNEKIVLFLGRLTMQKGPEYFLRAAKKVIEKYPNVRFVMAGSGDMIAQCVREAADLKLGQHVTFTGFLRGDDLAKIFQMADLYVMPSVSEPFGIAPLEALSHNVPVIISKQSGVSEVLTHALKVDFWDIDEMANKILAVLKHPPLERTLRQHGHIELRKLSWKDSAVKLKEIYAGVMGEAEA
jgi:glycosyltransferase involved in cell wall biosynthesis